MAASTTDTPNTKPKRTNPVQTPYTHMVSFRLDLKLFEKLPAENRTEFIKSVLTKHFDQPVSPDNDHQQLRDALVFFFELFQANARNLTLTAADKAKAKTILEMIQNAE
jgi:hypothetical protein